MTGLILYIIKSTLYLSVFYVFFMLVMRKTTFIRLNRIAFLTGSLICMVLPFIRIDMPENVTEKMHMAVIEKTLTQKEASESAVLAEAVISGDSPETERHIPFLEILFITGAAISFLMTARSYLLMRRMIRSVKPTYVAGVQVRIINAEIPSFSWGRHIVISRKDLEENPVILTHEKMHVRCGHSIDLMVYAIITTLHWFNPLVWIARTELKMLHEYEADDLTINKGIDATQYQLLLVKKAVGAKRFQLANGFNHSKLKNRITMMHKNKTNRWMRLAYILCVPVLIGTMCLCSSPKDAAKKIRNITVLISSHLDKEGTTLSDFTLNELDDAILNSGIDPEYISVQVTPEEGCTEEDFNAVTVRLQELDEKMSPSAKQEEEPLPFNELDQTPMFQGGDANQFSKWVNNNLTYPAEAKEKGLQGRITLTFTITSTGKVTDVKVLRGVDPILDNEAIRVLESSPDWTPGYKGGKPVSVKYTFPVIFRLGDTKKSAPLPFQFADTKPGFNGGDANEFSKWVAQNLQYPESCKEAGISGRVTMEFTISETGKVTDAKVLRGVHDELDKEALRVISMSPDWTPGVKDGKPVSIRFTFPVIFRL